MLPVAMAALDFLKQREQNQQNKQNKLLAAQTQVLSPWTKLQAKEVAPDGSPIVGAMGGYMSGVAQNQADDLAGLQQDRARAEIEAYKRGGSGKPSPWTILK
jgi:hypothetical protein